MEKLASDEHF